MARSKSPGAYGNRKPTEGRAIGAQAKQTDRQRRAELNLAPPEGYATCPVCFQHVLIRADGTLKGHSSRGQHSGVTCVGAQPRQTGAVDPTGEYPFECWCRESFATQGGLNLHITKAHRRRK